jgi:hypothetical protein
MDARGPNLGGLVIAVAALFLVLSWIIVALRTYCRLFLVRSFGMDDKTMLALLVIFSAYLGTQIYGATRGIGFHDSTISQADKTISLKAIPLSLESSMRSTHLLTILPTDLADWGAAKRRLDLPPEDLRRLLSPPLRRRKHPPVAHSSLHVVDDSLWIHLPVHDLLPVSAPAHVLDRGTTHTWQMLGLGRDSDHDNQCVGTEHDGGLVIRNAAVFHGTIDAAPSADQDCCDWHSEHCCSVGGQTEYAKEELSLTVFRGSIATIIRAIYIPTLLSGEDFLCKHPPLSRQGHG